MKKLLFLFAFIAFAFTVQAQTSMVSAAYTSNTSDTVIDAATKYLIPSSTISGLSKIVEVQFLAVENSGTTGGTATLQGSLDNTNWYTIGTAYTLTDVASQVTHFKITDYGTKYVRIKVTGPGTMETKISAKVLVRR